MFRNFLIQRNDCTIRLGQFVEFCNRLHNIETCFPNGSKSPNKRRPEQVFNLFINTHLAINTHVISKQVTGELATTEQSTADVPSRYSFRFALAPFSSRPHRPRLLSRWERRRHGVSLRTRRRSRSRGRPGVTARFRTNERPSVRQGGVTAASN